jgi:uncharacterized membrane protein YdbT with pleckstrin-like domain
VEDEHTGWRSSRITPRTLAPIVVIALALVSAVFLVDTALWPIGAVVVVVLAAVGYGPIRSGGGRSTDSEDYRRLMRDAEFKKPPNESDLL